MRAPAMPGDDAARHAHLSDPRPGALRVVLASNNAKKLAELQALFDGLGIELVKQGDLGVSEAEEPHATFL
jgi:XTP/dITP diphosphohydrolase